MKKFLWSYFCVFAWVVTAAEPFVWSAQEISKELTLRVVIDKNCYLYKSETNIRVPGGKLLEQPASTMHDDEFSGRVAVYEAGTHQWRYALEKSGVRAAVDYQGCRAAGKAGENAICFAPKTVELPQDNALTAAVASPSVAATALPARTAALLDKFAMVRKAEGLMPEKDFITFLLGTQEQNTSALVSRSIWIFCLLVLLGGLGLNLTPCVLPMIPVNLAIIGAGRDQGRWTGFQRGLAYGLGITVAYGTLGTVAVLTGARFGSLNASAWFNFAIAVLFLVLALAMLGMFNLDFSSYQSKFDPRKMRGGASVVAAACGMVAALLAGACVAPVVVSVIVFAAGEYAKGDYLALGLPFLLGLGMALPWPLAGAGMRLLPKPGMWMERVKQIFAALIILMSCYYAWIGYGLLPQSHDGAGEFAKFDQALEQAAAANMPVVIDFWATWCKNCREMDKVIHSRGVEEAMNGMKLVRFQAERLSDPEVKALLDRYALHGLPGFVLLKPNTVR